MKSLAKAWATAAVLGCLGASTHASPSPLRDFIDTCTHPVSSRSEITDDYIQRGWRLLAADYPDWVPNLLADGHLLWYLDLHPGNERLNILGVDKETAALPNMAQHMEAMIAAVAEGKSDILLSEGPSNAVVFVHWRNRESPQPGTTCYLYGDELTELDPLFDAFDQTIHDHLRREVGPTRVYSAFFRGDPPPERPEGLLRLAIAVGLLPSKPVSDPPIGAGPSSLSLHTYDQVVFSERYARSPKATYFLSASTSTSSEATQ